MQHGKCTLGKETHGSIVVAGANLRCISHKKFCIIIVQPWFLDGKLTTSFRGEPHIDGSFLSKANDYLPPQREKKIIFLDWQKDPEMQSKGGLDIVEALSPEGIWGLLERGKAYAEIMEAKGTLEALEKNLPS